MRKASAPPLPKRTKGVLWLMTIVSTAGVASGFVFSSEPNKAWLPLLLVELLILASIAITILAMKAFERRGGSIYSSVMFDLPKADRKRVAKAVQKGRSVEDIRLVPVAIAHANELISRSKWIFGMFAFLLTSQIFIAATATRSLLHIGIAAMYVVFIVLWTRLRKHARQSKQKNIVLRITSPAA